MVANTLIAKSEGSPSAPIRLHTGKFPSELRHRSTLPFKWDVGTVVAKSLLDRVHSQMMENEKAVDDAMVELMSGLWSLKSSNTTEAWQNVVDQCVNHRLCGLIHQDPFSARSFHKPRGYAGDAVLIDYIYSRDWKGFAEEEPSSLGNRIFRFNSETPACSAVRARRDLVAAIIDEICALTDHPSILSVACGHLREATLCRSVTTGQTGRFVALDQDKQSLDIVANQVSLHGVVPVCSSVKSLFRGEVAGEKFDFIYSTGLYDYLDDRIATKLTSRMFGMLKPGGRLLVANFLPEIWGYGYMESFMDWKLIYRTPEEMLAFAAPLPQSEIVARTYVERHGNIVFLDVIRK
jgi:extracellular factor (EF) 3-hydroxypalmitic acid methyl ester biosynthesis protein